MRWLWHSTASGDLQGSGGFSVTSALCKSARRGLSLLHTACSSWCQHTREQWAALLASWDVPSLAECVLWVLAVLDSQYAKEGWPLLLQLFLKCSVSVVTLRIMSETAATDGKSPKCKSCWHAQCLISDSSEWILRNLGTVAHDGLFLVWPVSSMQLISVSLCSSWQLEGCGNAACLWLPLLFQPC